MRWVKVYCSWVEPGAPGMGPRAVRRGFEAHLLDERGRTVARHPWTEGC